MAFNEPQVNPYDPTSPDYQPETLPSDEIIRRAIQAQMMGLRVCLPAQIVTVRGNQKVDVQTLLQSRYSDGTVVNIPAMQNVPVSMPMGADWSIKCPIAVGDIGLVIFCDRSLDVWLSGNGSIVDPQDSRQHDLSDPIFIPGLPTFTTQTTDSTTDMVLTNGAAVLRVQKAGKYKLSNAQNEVLATLVAISNDLKSLCQKLSNDTVTIASFGTPTPLANASQYASLATDLGTLITQLQGLQG